jgi:hypothetical protein
MLSDVLIRSVKRATRPRKLSDTGRLHLPERVNDFETPGCLRLESNSATHFDFPNLGTHAPSQIWHLESVRQWLVGRQQYHVEQRLLDIARIAMQCNLTTEEAGNLEPTVQRKIHALVA